jgi:hypothetical protein
LPGHHGGYDGSCYIIDDTTEQRLGVSCTQYAWCIPQSMCVCDADRCGATPDGIGAVFDIRVAGNQAQGVVDNDTTIFLEQLQ